MNYIKTTQGYPLGAKRSTPDVRDYRFVAGAGKAGDASGAPLPTSVTLPLAPVKNQGATPSCVAHATASLTEVLHLMEHDESELFSTEFVYGYRPEGYYQGDGMMPRDALKTLLHVGNVYARECPGNHRYNEASAQVAKHLEELRPLAAPHRIASFYRCDVGSIAATEALMKQALAQGHPLLISIGIRQGDHLDDKFRWVTDPKAEWQGCHGLLVYGYTPEGFLVQNSWGPGWGNHGRFLLPYGFDLLYEAWGVEDAEDPLPDDQIKVPFATRLGQLIAKALNGLLRIFAELFHRK